MVEDTQTPKEAPERKRLSEELDSIITEALAEPINGEHLICKKTGLKLAEALKRVLAVPMFAETGGHPHAVATQIIAHNEALQRVREAIDAE